MNSGSFHFISQKHFTCQPNTKQRVSWLFIITTAIELTLAILVLWILLNVELPHNIEVSSIVLIHFMEPCDSSGSGAKVIYGPFSVQSDMTICNTSCSVWKRSTYFTCLNFCWALQPYYYTTLPAFSHLNSFIMKKWTPEKTILGT